MCKCDICKRRSRAVTMLDHKVVCMVCLSYLLRGVKVTILGEKGDRVAILTDLRELIFQDRNPTKREPLPRLPLTQEEMAKMKTADSPPAAVKRGPGRPRKVPVPV